MNTKPLLLTLCSTAACMMTTPEPDLASPGSNAALSPKSTEIASAKVKPALSPEAAPAASPRLNDGELKLDDLNNAIASHFEGNVGRRHYIQTDKPIYKPGETVWLRAWDLTAKNLENTLDNSGFTLELINPKGAVVLTKSVLQADGLITNDFILPGHVKGGEYRLKVTTFDGKTTDRPILVSAYEPPRIQKKMEFLRKAYGPGDNVTASLEIKEATGAPIADQALKSSVFLDGRTLDVSAVTTNDEGGALVRFTLPETIQTGDGQLTIMVERGGQTESISKRIPIVLKKVELNFYPEGGHMVHGLDGRIYFEARNSLGKPADIQGVIIDDRGNKLAKFESYKDGLGRFDFTPSPGRSYHAQITQPVGITGKYSLPMAQEDGCTLRHYDDFDGGIEEIRVGLQCTEDQTVIVNAMLRDNKLDTAALDVEAGNESIVYLKSSSSALNQSQGVARVTLFDDERNPLAERLIYRNRRNSLNIDVTPKVPQVGPRDKVTLDIKTTDALGNAVQADLALSVVDDTVISFADDKTAHMLSRIFLESELPGKIEEPNFYLDLTEEKSAFALDLLMGTRGWRKFEWQEVFNPKPIPPPRVQDFLATANIKFDELAVEAGPLVNLEDAVPAPAVQKNKLKRNVAKPQAAPIPEQKEIMAVPAMDLPAMKVPKVANKRMMADKMGKISMMEAEEPAPEFDDELWEEQAIAYAPVRVFPAPVYDADFSGIRTDFRDTIYWTPKVSTNEDGSAEVSFHTSDAITSFRIFTEGNGQQLVGRNEQTFESSLPFSLTAKLPLAVTEGDEILLPLALNNSREDSISVNLSAEFGPQLSLGKKMPTQVSLEAGTQESMFYPLSVVSDQGNADITFSAKNAGLTDAFQRTLKVDARGFPLDWSKSGTVLGKSTHSFALEGALESGMKATIKFYPSPLSTLVSGMDGMLREPSGCFEQTSSTNYPNIMVMQYLEEHDAVAPALVTKSKGLMERGYAKLTSYETSDKGYEWFGGSPGHEALTAYGVLEFVDMKSVYPDVSQQMINRTSKWLLSRRDGKGGFKKNPRALDSFGRASDDVTNAYITYSLTEAGIHDIPKEIDTQKALAMETKDAYLLALSTATLLNVPSTQSSGQKSAKRLANMQDKDGAWSKADHSITRSGGNNLTIESTALATLALLKAGGFDDEVRKSISWLEQNRGGYGQWGATQATVLALKAMTTYANQSRVISGDGEVSIIINGKDAGRFVYKAGHKDTIEFTDLGQYLRPGDNQIELKHEGEMDLPFTIAVAYRSESPASSDNVAVDLSTELNSSELKMGDPVRLVAKITNKRNEGLPMTLVRVGLPGGLVFQNWQLKELREKGQIAFYETREREIILYLRDMKPEEERTLPIDLIAQVPGHYTGPASSAYLYYDNEDKDWEAGLKVNITP